MLQQAGEWKSFKLGEMDPIFSTTPIRILTNS